MNLLDTDVMIEIQKGSPNAVAWLKSAAATLVSVPATVALEMILGSRDKAELRRADHFLDGFDVLSFAKEDYEKAYAMVKLYKLTTGLGLADFLIAAQALNRQATLYTFNLKHFGAIPGLDARPPYLR